MTLRGVFRVALTLVAAACVVLALRSLAGQWGELRAQPVHWALHPGWLLAALAAAMATYIVLIDSWRRVVAGYDHAISLPAAGRVWLLSNLGKYLPGSLWIVAGMAVLAKREGVRPGAAVTSAAIMQALALVSGLAIGATAPGALAALPSWAPEVASLLAALSVLGLGVLASPRAITILQGLLPASAPALEPIRPRALLVALAGNLVAWAGYGLLMHLLVRGMTEAALPVTTAAGAFAVAYLAGLLAVPVPSGLGVRESIFIALLQPDLGLGTAAALAIAARLVTTLVELGLAIPAALSARGTGEATSPPPSQ